MGKENGVNIVAYKHIFAVNNLIEKAKNRGDSKIEYFYNGLDMKTINEIDKITANMEQNGYKVTHVINEDWIDLGKDIPEITEKEEEKQKLVESMENNTIRMMCRMDIEWD